MLAVNLALMLGSLVLELLFVLEYDVIVWLTASLHGIGQSTVLPSSLTWLDELIEMNSRNAGSDSEYRHAMFVSQWQLVCTYFRDTAIRGMPGDDVYCRDPDAVGVPGNDVYPGPGRLVDGRTLFVVLSVAPPGLCLRHDAALHGAVPLHQAHRCGHNIHKYVLHCSAKVYRTKFKLALSMCV